MVCIAVSLLLTASTDAQRGELCAFACCVLLQELSLRLAEHFKAADKKPNRALQAPAGRPDDTASSQQQETETSAANGTQPPFKLTFDDALPLQVCSRRQSVSVGTSSSLPGAYVASTLCKCLVYAVHGAL